MPQTVIQTSFASGEFAPQLYSRVDLEQYKIGLALARNFYIDYRGGASNRPGTGFVGPCKSNLGNVRAISFQFSTIQAYALEFGEEYIRVVKDGAYVTEATKVITGITKANPAVVTSAAHGYSNGDWVFLAGIGGMTQLNGRTAIVAGATTNTYQLHDTNGNNINSTSYGTYTSGGTSARIYTITTPYQDVDIFALKYTQSADVLTITHPSYPPSDLTRTAHNAWTLTEITFKSNATTPTGLTLVTSSASVAQYFGYTVTSVNANGEESLGCTPVAIGSVDPLVVTTAIITLDWTPVADAEFYNIYRAPKTGNTRVPPAPVPPFYYIGTTKAPIFSDGGIVSDISQTPPNNSNPFAISPIANTIVTAPGTGYTSTPTVGITDATGTGAHLVAVVGTSTGVVDIIILNGGINYTAPTLTITGGGGSGATATASVGPGTGTYPGVVTYFSQRKVFAHSNNFPQTFWMTKVTAYTNMDFSNPIEPSDSIQGTLSSRQVNAIKSLVEMPGGLLSLTSDRVFQINGSGGGEPISPINVGANPQSNKGASDLSPLVIDYDVIYIQDKSAGVIDLEYAFQSNIYTSTDISLISSHLFANYTIKDWTYAEVPYKLVWAVRSDGKLLSLTYLKTQKFIAWSHHDTNGLFKSTCSISEGNENAVYLVVVRQLQNQLVQCMERFASRNLKNSLENAWFLDCALQTPLTYPNATLTPSARSGLGVAFVADNAIFSSGDIGKIIRIGGGKATITSLGNTFFVLADITQEITDIFPDDPDNTPVYHPAGDWSLASVVSSVSGLDHLEGEVVQVFGDGRVLTEQTVVGGSVTVSIPSSLVLVGLPYVAQLQALPLEIPQRAGTSQSRRKEVPNSTFRIVQSTGFSVGMSFDDAALYEWRITVDNFDAMTPLLNGLYTGDYRRNIGYGWDNFGQLCIQQDRPEPVTLTGVIPEVAVGDTP